MGGRGYLLISPLTEDTSRTKNEEYGPSGAWYYLGRYYNNQGGSKPAFSESTK